MLDISFSSCQRIALLGLIVLLTFTIGCEEAEQGSARQNNPQKSDGATTEVEEKLIFRSSNYSVSQEDYLDPESEENCTLEAISNKVTKASWDDKDLRPKFVLVRINRNGKSDLICVKRNESEEGQLIVELNTRIGDDVFEAESEVDSPATMVKIVQAFFERDPTIKNIIEWDLIVE